MLGYTGTRWVWVDTRFRYIYIQTGFADIIIDIVNVWLLASITSNKTQNTKVESLPTSYVLLFSWIQIMGHT